MIGGPLTLGTAGHVDHGKTALVHALTGIDTDRLAEEHRRGISIELGYAPLDLPSGRRLSVVDVPGHERFVRTMVAGATGIDLYLLVVAANDGVMPQTIEHAEILKVLGVTAGVVAITKTDIANPEQAHADTRDLLAPWTQPEIITCSTKTGEGLSELCGALERATRNLPSKTTSDDPILHIDRAFTIHGAGTVVTGTLWAGTISAGDQLVILPAGTSVRVRAIHVHDQRVQYVAAGQRVALNLTGIRTKEAHRGDVVTMADALRPSYILDAKLELAHQERVFRAIVHHGTRETRGRVVTLEDGRWQLRVEHPLLARTGDPVVVRGIAPTTTLGGGVIIDPNARHGTRHSQVASFTCVDRRSKTTAPSLNGRALNAHDLAVEQQIAAAGYEPPLDTELPATADELSALRHAGRIVRLGTRMHVHARAIDTVAQRVLAVIEREGSITVGRLRDELGTSRKYALALLEYLDTVRFTIRQHDNSRTARRR